MKLTKFGQFLAVSLFSAVITAALLLCAHIGNDRAQDTVRRSPDACQEDEVVAFDGTCTHRDTAVYEHGKWYPIIPPEQYTK